MQKADEKLYMDEPDWQLLNPLTNLNLAKIGKTPDITSQFTTSPMKYSCQTTVPESDQEE